jgi:hypothetical protein
LHRKQCDSAEEAQLKKLVNNALKSLQAAASKRNLWEQFARVRNSRAKKITTSRNRYSVNELLSYLISACKLRWIPFH